MPQITSRSSAEEVNAKLLEFFQMMQKRAQTDDLEQHSRQRVHALETSLQQKEMEFKELEERFKVQTIDHENLRHQLCEAEIDNQRQAQALRQEREDHHRTHRELMRAQHDSETAEIAKKKAQTRVEELERAEHDWHEKVRKLSGVKASIEAQAEEREQELSGRLASVSDAARRLEGEKRALEGELEKLKSQLKDNEQETRELRCRSAVLDDELRGAHEQKQRCEQEQQKAVRDALQDSGQWRERFLDSKKENAQLQKTQQELSTLVWELEDQLRQERTNYCSPAELLKLSKAHESESLLAERNQLMLALMSKTRDMDLYVKRVQEQDLQLKEMQHTRACQKAMIAGA